MNRELPRIHNFPGGLALATCYDKTQDKSGEFEMFLAVSATLTGFSEAELLSTGLAVAHFDELALTVGRPLRWQFLEVAQADPPATMTDQTWAPLARNLLRQWYLGQWQGLGDWAVVNFGTVDRKGKTHLPEGYNEFGKDSTRVISPAAYQEGLVWRAAGVNPPGAKQPGFASWVKPL